MRSTLLDAGQTGQRRDLDAEASQLVRRWVERGLLTPTQAEAIAASEGWGSGPEGLDTRGLPRDPRHRRTSVTAEALGYLGVVLVVVAASLITARYWPGLSSAGRLSLPVGAAVLLLGAGLVAGHRSTPEAVRVRSVLWLGSVAALGVACWVLGHDVLGWSTAEDVLLLLGPPTAVYAAVLRARTGRFLQLAGLFVPVVLTAGAAAARLEDGGDGPVGLALCGTSAAWLALAWGGLLPPRRGALVLGALGLVVGTLSTLSEDWGYVFGLLSIVALVGVAVVVGDVLVLTVAAVGALIVVPATITRYFPSVLAAPLALMVAGLMLVGLALRAVRRHGLRPPARLATLAAGRPGVAMVVAACIALGSAAAALALGKSG